MHSADEPGPITPGMSDGPPDSAAAVAPGRRSRIRRMFSASRDLWRVVYRDPEHVPERLTLYTTGRLGDPSREWAQSMLSSHPDTPVAKIAEELRTPLGARRADRRCDLRNSLLHRTRARLPHLSAAGDAHDAAHRRALRPRPARAANLGGDARAARRAPRRRRRGGRADFGPRQGTPRSTRTPAIVAHMGSQRLPAAHLRRVHVPVGRRRRQRDAWQGQSGVRCRDWASGSG